MLPYNQFGNSEDGDVSLSLKHTLLKEASDLIRDVGMKEGNILFNDALNTFYLRLYGVRHMVKYHTDSERGNPLPPHELLFPICTMVPDWILF